MKHVAFGLFVSLVCGTGCVSSLPLGVESAKSSAPVEHVARAPVQAEQVTPRNAHKQAQSLWDELDRASQEELTGTPAEKR